LDLFEHQWATYRSVVDADLMDHRAITAATAAALTSQLDQRPPGAGAAQLVDLGCGDLGLLAPVLRSLPLGSYTGLDLTADVLPLAEAALGSVTYPCHWLQGDLLSWALESPQTRSIDILHAAFSIHHLNGDQKQTFLQQTRPRMAPGSIFLWADVFREPDESREEYVERYSERVRSHWPLAPERQEQVINHLSRFDFPADRSAIEAIARASGWQWQWLWQGSQQAEALALLTPA
jgi:predicted TPR repeat methyltransferase